MEWAGENFFEPRSRQLDETDSEMTGYFQLRGLESVVPKIGKVDTICIDAIAEGLSARGSKWFGPPFDLNADGLDFPGIQSSNITDSENVHTAVA